MGSHLRQRHYSAPRPLTPSDRLRSWSTLSPLAHPPSLLRAFGRCSLPRFLMSQLMRQSSFLLLGLPSETTEGVLPRGGRSRPYSLALVLLVPRRTGLRFPLGTPLPRSSLSPHLRRIYSLVASLLSPSLDSGGSLNEQLNYNIYIIFTRWRLGLLRGRRGWLVVFYCSKVQFRLFFFSVLISDLACFFVFSQLFQLI